MEHPIDMFQSGLTKGIEIAEKALKFARENAVNGNDGCWDFNPHDQILQSLTDSELLEIYLTENEKKWKEPLPARIVLRKMPVIVKLANLSLRKENTLISGIKQVATTFAGSVECLTRLMNHSMLNIN